LPDYDRAGALLMFERTGALRMRLPYDARSFAALLLERSAEGLSMAEAMAALSASGLLEHMVAELATKRNRLVTPPQ
jgi:hypothetical protein